MMKASIGPDPSVDIYAAPKGGPKPLSSNFKLGLSKSKEKSPNASPNTVKRRKDDSNKLNSSSRTDGRSAKGSTFKENQKAKNDFANALNMIPAATKEEALSALQRSLYSESQDNEAYNPFKSRTPTEEKSMMIEKRAESLQVVTKQALANRSSSQRIDKNELPDLNIIDP